jgi:hypothetical protein
VYDGGVFGFGTGEGPSAGNCPTHKVTITNHFTNETVEVEAPEDRWVHGWMVWLESCAVMHGGVVRLKSCAVMHGGVVRLKSCAVMHGGVVRLKSCAVMHGVVMPW